MGKNQKSTTKMTIKELENQICKHKSFKANIESFIKKLRIHHQNITTKQYLIKIHNYITNFKTITRGAKGIGAEVYNYSKVCKECGDWKRNKLIECIQCEDYYHKNCAKNNIDDENQWLCPSCQQLCQEIVTRQKKLDKDCGLSKKKIKNCQSCKQNIQQNDINRKCIKCCKQYHEACFGKSDSSIVCQSCHKNIKQQIETRKSYTQTDLGQFLTRIQNNIPSFYQKGNEDLLSTSDENSLTISIADTIQLRKPVKLSKEEIQHFKQGLLYAILSKGMEYRQENVYEQIQRFDKIQQIDLSIERMSAKDFEAFKEYKKQPIGPFQIKAVQGMGYDVTTTKNISKGTIICEYVGQVITRRQAIKYADNDSLMELLTGPNADESLIILPQKYTNLGRFLNGVNNHKKQSQDKVNVQSVRFSVLGQPTVILYAKKFIKAGETLQYDYNAGGLNKFPTEHFI